MNKFIAVIGRNCVACGACMKVCPRNAIEVKRGIKAVIDEAKCVGCGICVNICPAGIIEKKAREIYE